MCELKQYETTDIMEALQFLTESDMGTNDIDDKPNCIIKICVDEIE